MTTRRFRGLYRFRHYGLWGVKVSKVKKVRKITLSFICSKRCWNFAGKKYFERHSEA